MALALLLDVGETEKVAVPERETESEREGERDPLSLAESEAEADEDHESVAVGEGDAVPEGETLPADDGDVVMDTLVEAEPLCDEVGVTWVDELLPRVRQLCEAALMLPVLDGFAATVCDKLGRFVQGNRSSRGGSHDALARTAGAAVRPPGLTEASATNTTSRRTPR